MVGYRSGHNGVDLKSTVPACIRLGRSNRSPIAIRGRPLWKDYGQRHIVEFEPTVLFDLRRSLAAGRLGRDYGEPRFGQNRPGRENNNVKLQQSGGNHYAKSITNL